MLRGKRGFVVGIANGSSIAAGCARAFADAGATLAAGPALAKERLVFVGHWPVSDPYFNVVRNSARSGGGLQA